MPSTLEYMQFATNVYAASALNTIGVPTGWTRIDWQPDTFTGFSAGVYKNDQTGELVISYTGTNDGVADPLNWSAGLGIPAPQIYQAMAYYFAFRSAYPDANITFTGHSLGGGLASLMAVLFDKPATVFDAAPFGLAAINPALLPSYGAAMATSGYRDEALATYIELVGLPLFTRASNVTQFYVQGEVLQYARALSANISGFDYFIQLANSTAGLVERHSMALMTALQLSDSFHQVAQKLPNLISMMLDSNLFAASSPLDTNADLLRTLLRHQLGVAGAIQPDDMLNRFATDMNTFDQAGSASTPQMLGHALIAFAMEKYYSETTADASQQAALFKAVTGGLQFDTSKINADITAAKGYQQYFTNYLSSAMFTPDEANLIRNKISTLHDWSIAVGSSGMTASDSQNHGALMIGNFGNDTLTGGTAADLLAEEAANDSVFEMWVAA